MSIDMQQGKDSRDNDIFDVAIVGYGPVGQALALKLARQGHRLAVIERWPTLFGLPRAVGLDHEAMRILQSLGIAEEFAQHTALSQVYEWHNGDGDLLVAFPGLDKMGGCGWPTGNGFSQPSLERILDARVRQDHADRVEVLQGVTVTGLTEAKDCVMLELRATDAQADDARHIAARYVVGCDGAGSIVRQAMGVDYEDLAFAADWLVVDLQPKNPSHCTTELIQVCDPSRPTTMVTGGPGRRRFEFMMLDGEHKEDFNNPQAAWSLLQHWGWTAENALLERHAVYTFRACVANAWYRGQVMIAGDAAHLTPPFAAQGLCAGLRDVAALSWRLDLVLRERAPVDLLDSYSSERRAHARALVEFAVELGHIICVLEPDAARERDAHLRAQAKQLSQQKMPAPRLGDSLLIRSGDPSSGHLSRQGRIRHQSHVKRLDDLVAPGFVLIGHGHDPASALQPEQLAFLQNIGATTIGIGPECAVHDMDGTYPHWFEELGCRAVLLRPDFYIYGAGEAGALVDDLRAAWKRLQGSQPTPEAA